MLMDCSQMLCSHEMAKGKRQRQLHLVYEKQKVIVYETMKTKIEIEILCRIMRCW